VRTLRAEFTIPADRPLPGPVVSERGGRPWSAFQAHAPLISLLTGCPQLNLAPALQGGDRQGSIPVAGSGFEAFVHIREAVDISKETARLRKELSSIEQALQRTAAKLANPAFVGKAPAEVVDKERARQAELGARRDKIAGYIRDLQEVPERQGQPNRPPAGH